MDFLSFKKLVLHPEDFFKSIAHEKGWKNAYFSVVFSFVIYAVFALLLTFLVLEWLGNLSTVLESPELISQVDARWMEAIYGLLVYAAFVIVLPLFLPVSHFLAIKCGGKGSKDDTAKSIFYPNVPGLVLGWIPLIGSIVWIWCLYIWYVGFKTLHKMTKRQFLVFGFLEAIISLLIFFVISIIIGEILLLFGVPIIEI